MSNNLDEELIREFFSETYNQIEIIESSLLNLEKNPKDKKSIDEIFRAVHTLKGSSATVQMMELNGFAHVIEDVFDAIRNDEIEIKDSTIDILLEALDVIKSMVEKRDNGEVYEKDINPLIEAIESLVPNIAKKDIEVKKSKVPSFTPETQRKVDYSDLKKINGDNYLYKISIELNEEDPMREVAGVQLFALLKDRGSVIQSVPDYDELYNGVFSKEVTYYYSTNKTIEELELILNIPGTTNKIDIESIEESKTDSNEENKIEPKDRKIEKDEEVKDKKVDNKKTSTLLRVESSRIDLLLNLVSEIVINKATFSQITTEFNSSMLFLQDFQRSASFLSKEINDIVEMRDMNYDLQNVKLNIDKKLNPISAGVKGFQTSFKSTMVKFKNSLQNMNRIIGELQEGVMKIRMVPIGHIFTNFHRTVRDLSKKLEKKVNLVTLGDDVELDKSVAEDLKDPLMHCVRNSMDHGIEMPEIRKSKGKNTEGTVILKASNEGSLIFIEISDDGAGINLDKIKNRAIEKGILKRGEQISESETYNLLFNPGFSTAEEVTDISGRGVGLDVVKSNIEKLNGTINISSEIDIGTTFTIRIPLTLAIIQGLLVKVFKETYVIPIASIIDSHRIKLKDIKLIDNYDVIDIRGEFISVLKLNKLFNIPKEEDEYGYIVIVSDGVRKLGVLVDNLLSEEDVVIKPLKDDYVNVPGIAGANITGDGKVSLIIDVPKLIDLGYKKEMIKKERREAQV